MNGCEISEDNLKMEEIEFSTVLLLFLHLR